MSGDDYPGNPTHYRNIMGFRRPKPPEQTVREKHRRKRSRAFRAVIDDYQTPKNRPEKIISGPRSVVVLDPAVERAHQIEQATISSNER